MPATVIRSTSQSSSWSASVSISTKVPDNEQDMKPCINQDNEAAALDKDVSSLPQEVCAEVLCTTNVSGAEHISMKKVELEISRN
jgi:hypothetical protein